MGTDIRQPALNKNKLLANYTKPAKLVDSQWLFHKLKRLCSYNNHKTTTPEREETYPMLSVHDVFVPNSQPIHTYVDRSESQIEEKLKDAFEIRNMVVSVSGPSKSGKTVLVKRVVNGDYLIPISGSAIKSSQDLWEKVLAWMEAPSEVSYSDSTEYGGSANAEGGGKIGIPFVAEGQAKGGATVSASKKMENTKTVKIDPQIQVTKEISDSDFVIFIDDFHYIDRSLQIDIAKQVKTAAENGVKICIASVPHRSEDVVRANSELRGRLSAIDLSYWSVSELEQIGKIGFPLLNIDLASSAVNRLAKEAFGSPQLMQSLCLSLCLEKMIRKEQEKPVRIEINEKDFRGIFERTSAQTNYSKVLNVMHDGPKERGQERKTFEFIDGSTGDVYRSILLAIKSDSASLALKYDEIMDRIKRICKDSSPVGSSVTTSLSKMYELVDTISSSMVIEWDENILDIVDPYFLFYLRGSREIDRLGGLE